MKKPFGRPPKIKEDQIPSKESTQVLNNKHNINSGMWESMTIFEKTIFNMFMDYLCKTDTQFSVRHEDMAVIDYLHWQKMSYNISLKMAQHMSENLIHVASEAIISAQLHIVFKRLINHYEEFLPKSSKGPGSGNKGSKDNLESR